MQRTSDAHACLAAVRPWLRELADAEYDRAPRRQALLLGVAWLTEGRHAADVGSLTRALVERGPSVEVGELLALDPLLIGLAARATGAGGDAYPNPWLEALDGAARALPDSRERPPLFAAVLEAVGLSPAAAVGPLPPRPPLLTREAVVWHHMALTVGACGAFGRRTPPGPDGDALADALRLWLTAALRRYDLQVSAALVRALLWLDRRAVAPVDHALELLIRHQHPRGWFGHYGPELVGHPLADDEHELQWSVHLPTALTVCWTLRQSIASAPVF